MARRRLTQAAGLTRHNLADTGVLVLLHFPASDGQGPGVEHHPAASAPNSNSAN